MKKTKRKLLAVIFLSILLYTSKGFADTRALDILAQLKVVQSKIGDTKSYYVQTLTGLPGTATRVEKGLIYRKGNKLRKEIQEPVPTLIISTPEFVYEKNLKSGRVKKESIADHPEFGNFQNQDPEKLFERFNFQLNEENDDRAVLTGLSGPVTLTLTIDKRQWVLSSMRVQGPSGQPTEIGLTYELLNTIPILKRMVSTVPIPIGKTVRPMTITIDFTGSKVNAGLNDTLFVPE